jgi:molecular chaperone DnaJ
MRAEAGQACAGATLDVMATTERDYYELLGVSRGAEDPEIKRAFRRLARELHPDVSEAPDAEERFREVVEAYEVLSKPETRELYDRFGHAGLRSGGFEPGRFDFGNLTDLFSAFFGDDLFGVGARPRRSRGADLAAEVEVELLDAASGTKREVPFQVAAACATCGGNGAEPGTAPSTCSECGGAGRLQRVSSTAFGQFVQSQPCPRCSGRGRIVEHPCHACRGAGQVLQERRLEVEIPAGIHDGQRIRLSGEGHAGALGARAGDLYVLVRVKPDPRFVREGNDIFSTIDLTMIEAALGATVTIPTLDGERELEFPPGTQAGELRVLRGAGMPVLQGFGRGDHRVLISVAVPRQLSEEQRRLLEEFERLSGEDTYRPDEGFFDKLKSAFR